VEFVEAPLFTRLLSGYLEDDEYQRLQLSLAPDPEAGDVYLVKDVQIWLLTLYDKDEAVDLSAKEKRLLKAAIEKETRQRSRLRGSKG
jgi:hypothetical protein